MARELDFSNLSPEATPETGGRVSVGPNGQECGNCYFWRAPCDSIHRQCMRYPPLIGVPTSPLNWCGEWKWGAAVGRYPPEPIR